MVPEIICFKSSVGIKNPKCNCSMCKELRKNSDSKPITNNEVKDE